MFLGTAIWFFSSLVIVVACYRAMQRVTVILKRLELYLNRSVFLQMLRSTDIVRLNCGGSVSFLPLFAAVHRLCFKMRDNICFKLNKMLTP